MIHNSSRTSSRSQISQRTRPANPMEQTVMFERDVDGWWASRKLGEDTILGHGSTKEEALQDLGRHMAGFVQFLNRTAARNGVAATKPDLTIENR